jgi:hypothetical protein
MDMRPCPQIIYVRFSKMIEISNILNNPILKNPYFIAGISLIIVWAIYTIFFRSSNSHFEENQYESFASSSSSNEPIGTLVLYHASWCPHCVNALPEWYSLCPKETSASHPKEFVYKTSSGKTVRLLALEESTDSDEAESWMGSNKVGGYPTIRLYGADKKEISEYEGPRTQDGIVAFLNQAF